MLWFLLGLGGFAGGLRLVVNWFILWVVCLITYSLYGLVDVFVFNLVDVCLWRWFWFIWFG